MNQLKRENSTKDENNSCFSIQKHKKNVAIISRIPLMSAHVSMDLFSTIEIYRQFERKEENDELWFDCAERKSRRETTQRRKQNATTKRNHEKCQV